MLAHAKLLWIGTEILNQMAKQNRMETAFRSTTTNLAHALLQGNRFEPAKVYVDSFALARTHDPRHHWGHSLIALVMPSPNPREPEPNLDRTRTEPSAFGTEAAPSS